MVELFSREGVAWRAQRASSRWHKTKKRSTITSSKSGWNVAWSSKGTEVKSMRQGRMNLKESFAIVKDGEVLVCGMHISPYEQGNIFNTDPLRQKKLLLHKSQIRHLAQEVGKMGYSLIPLQVYLKDGRFKMELGLCKGKKLHDKRDDMAAKDAQRDIQRALRSKNRGDD